MMINYKVILQVISVLFIILGLFILSAAPFSIIYKDGSEVAILLSGFITLISGILMYFSFKSNTNKQVGKREGYLIVAMGWLCMSFIGALPYLFSGTFSTLSEAVFESVSGLTTTGASVVNDIEGLPHGILFWRSLTQWIGGMGIIVLTVAIFPLLGIGGVELFVAEAPGPTSDKIHPRIRETAKRLWLIYVGLTGLLCLILYGGGMNFFDAINHALTTMATGGFSTKNTSMMAYDTPLIQYPIILFMFLAGTNYTVIYFALNGKFKKVWRSDEFKAYLGLVILLILISGTSVFFLTDLGFEKSFRDAAFQVVSIITTTGFVSADYTVWHPALTMLFFILIFVGASAGSTSGGIKIIRHLVFFKNSLLEFKRLLHPRAMIRIKIDKTIVAPRILTHILVFLLIYLICFVIGSILMAVILRNTDAPLLTAIGSVATALSNVGPGIGEVGPVDNFSAIPASGKWLLSFLMLLGRLELFTILILFTPYFWKGN